MYLHAGVVHKGHCCPAIDSVYRTSYLNLPAVTMAAKCGDHDATHDFAADGEWKLPRAAGGPIGWK